MQTDRDEAIKQIDNTFENARKAMNKITIELKENARLFSDVPYCKTKRSTIRTQEEEASSK